MANWPIFACRFSTSCSVVPGLARIAAKQVLCTLDQALLPVLDLIRVNIKPLGQLSNGMLTLHGCQSNLRLEGRGVIASLSSGHLLLLLVRES